MSDVLKDLWYGKLHFAQRELSSEYRALLNEYIDCTNKMKPLLSDEITVYLDQLHEIQMRIDDCLEREAFELGVRFGIQLFLQS